MAYCKRFRNDVFISYAHDDNHPDLDGQRWISRFVGQLTNTLRQRLGCRDELSVFWDQPDLNANCDLDTALLEEIQNAAVFVAFVSPAYQQGTHTIRELEIFTELAGAESRLFPLEVLPNELHVPGHPVFEAKPRFKFWRNGGPECRVPMALDPITDRNLYMQRITEFAEQVKMQLKALHQPANEKAAAEPRQKTSATVLLAQVTDDLEFERESVKSYLSQAGITVVPEADYPQGGEIFCQAYQSDLARADLVVQLLGRATGLMPADMPSGYQHYQNQAAQDAGKPIISWRHPELDLAQVNSEIQRSLLAGETVVSIGLEAFKSDVVRTVHDLTNSARAPRTSLVFVGADRSDLRLAEDLRDAIAARKIPVALPIYEGSAEDIQNDLEENLLDSDAVLFLHGSAPATWVRGFLRRFNRLLALRDTPPSKTMLVKAPPPKDPEVGITLPYLDVVDCSDKFDVNRVMARLESLD